MSQDNSTTIIGNITRDPELRFTPSGTAVCQIGVAVNRVWTDRQTNERKEEVSFFDVVCWDTLAENVGESLQKGDRVMVSGSLQQRSWEDKDTGDKRSKVEIKADEIGPSLRWATAATQRNAKRNGDGAPHPVDAMAGASTEPF